MPARHPAVRKFAVRAARAAFAVGALRATGAVATAVAAGLVGARLVGWTLPSPWPLVGLVLPIVAFGAWSARRARLRPAEAAVHLDRRLGLGGLLVAGEAGGELDREFVHRLDDGLRGLSAVLPRVAWRTALPTPLLAGVALAVVVLLPPPQVPPQPPQNSALVEAQLEQTEQGLRDLFARGEVPDEVKDELLRRLGELKDAAAAGQAVDWRDLDDLEKRLQRETQLQQLAEVAKRADGRPKGGAATGAGKPPKPEQLAAAAKALLDSGMLDKLSPALQEALRNAKLPDGSFDPSKLNLDPAAIEELLGKMGDWAKQLGQLAEGLDPQALEELKRLAEQFAQQPFGDGGMGQGFGEGFGEGEGEGEGEGLGRGGVSRGPGHAPLRLDEDAQGGADGSLKLPPGAPLPGDWVPVGSSLKPAEAAPVPNAGPGGAAAGGAGGATWQLDLAPRHRSVVRRFFGGEDKR